MSGQNSGSAALARALDSVFDEKTLTTIEYDGRPAWLVEEVGAALGYTRWKLSRMLVDKWADELIEGKDFARVAGDEFKALNELVELDCPQSGESSWGGARSGTLLFESGIHIITVLSRKPAGKALRRHLADEVLPKLVRGEPVMASREAQIATEFGRFALGVVFGGLEHRPWGPHIRDFDKLLEMSRVANELSRDEPTATLIGWMANEWVNRIRRRLRLPPLAPLDEPLKKSLAATERRQLVNAPSATLGWPPSGADGTPGLKARHDVPDALTICRCRL